MDSIHKHYEVEELKLTVEGSFLGWEFFSTTIDCLKDLIEAIDKTGEYEYSLPRAISLDYMDPDILRTILKDPVVIAEDQNFVYSKLNEMTKDGIIIRANLEHPGGSVCLQTGLKNVFYADETFIDDTEIQHTHINDDGEILGYLGVGTIACSFLDETVLCFPESRKVWRLLDGLGVAKRNINFMCFPHLRCHDNNIAIVAFHFVSIIGGCRLFNERKDKTISFHHVLEEAIGVASCCGGGCGKKLPIDANYCSHCGKITKKRKLEDEK